MNSKKNKVSLFVLCLSIAIIAVIALTWSMGSRDATAFPGAADATGSCTTCHIFGPGPGPNSLEHTAHLNRGAVCADCHGTPFNNSPLTSACGACHLISPFGSTTGTGLACINATHISTCQSCHGTCPTPTDEICDDDIDNDGDGDIDCADTDCAGNPACVQTETNCSDNIDNDGDGSTDCADPDCAGNPACVPTETNCSDRIDNDGDGSTDCADPDCAGNPVCSPTGPPADHTVKRGHTMHKPGLKEPFTNKCTDCHGADLRGSNIAPSCYKCHGSHWKWKDDPGGKGKKYDGRGGHDGPDRYSGGRR